MDLNARVGQRTPRSSRAEEYLRGMGMAMEIINLAEFVSVLVSAVSATLAQLPVRLTMMLK